MGIRRMRLVLVRSLVLPSLGQNVRFTVMRRFPRSTQSHFKDRISPSRIPV